jgi:hypothetical protein
VASVLDSCVADPGSSPRLCFFFLKHVYNGYGDHNISLLSSFCIFFCFLLLLTFQKGRSAVGFSTCYDGNCLLLCNNCSQCLIVNLTTSFHIVVQMYYQYRMEHIRLRSQACRIPDGTRRKCNQSKKIIGN